MTQNAPADSVVDQLWEGNDLEWDFYSRTEAFRPVNPRPVKQDQHINNKGNERELPSIQGR